MPEPIFDTIEFNFSIYPLQRIRCRLAVGELFRPTKCPTKRRLWQVFKKRKCIGFCIAVVFVVISARDFTAYRFFLTWATELHVRLIEHTTCANDMYFFSPAGVQGAEHHDVLERYHRP